MKNLSKKVRNTAINIANTLLEEKKMDEGRAISIAIAKAREKHNKK